jgi:hypothetical protein
MSLESEVEQMINDMIKKEGLTRSDTLRILRSKFESEERHQEVAYVNNLLKKKKTIRTIKMAILLFKKIIDFMSNNVMCLFVCLFVESLYRKTATNKNYDTQMV